jgi:DNA polymerase elongation subunit (family B)
VVIASFVTSHGRRRLFEFILEAVKKGHTILYCDTDSLVIKRKKNQASLAEGWQKIFLKKKNFYTKINLGSFLGDMKRENPHRLIIKFVGAGAKNWATMHSDLNGGDIRITRKIRGFELTRTASEKLTFEAIVRQVKRQFGKKQMYLISLFFIILFIKIN